MDLKISFGAVACPGCGVPMVYHDYVSTGLYLAKCKECGKEWELRKRQNGEIHEIKPKRIN